MRKFSILRDLLLRERVITKHDIIPPQPCPWDILSLVHTHQYLDALRTGTMTRQDVRKMGLPWTEALVRRSRIAVQGTINAAHAALEDSIAGNLAGGTHHAYPDHAQGFCVLNDVAIAIKHLISTNHIKHALVFDLDVHQGNGTAAIFRHDPVAFTFSMHAARNFPLKKETSDRDVPLEDRTTDHEYLAVLEQELATILDRATRALESPPDLVFYLAGIDVLADDKFGRLSLTPQGLAARDRAVIDHFRAAGLPICLLLSGGYAPTHERTAHHHATLYREARAHIDAAGHPVG